MDIEIADLRLLRAVAETGSLAGAARELGTNQGNLSRRLQRIERATGMVIFRRGHHGATPTAAGRLLLRGADAVLPLVDQLLATTGTQPPPPADPAPAAPSRPTAPAPPGTPSVQLGAVPNPLLPVIAGHLGSLLPHAPIALRTADAGPALLDLIRARCLDLAVFRYCPGLEGPLPDGVETAVVAEERLLIGFAERHRLAGRRRLTLADLGSETCILTETGHSALRRHFLAVVERGAVTASSGARPMLCWAADDAEAAALACAMSAVLPAYPFPAPVPGISYLPLDEPAARCQLMLAWPPDGRLAPQATRLAELARQSYPGTGTPAPPPAAAAPPTLLDRPVPHPRPAPFPLTPTYPHAAVPYTERVNSA
ncbi:LysR family transcriptional regulator [Streptomyces sp. NPDC018031]|uniref:LysR family transcriptional regulator n=1 Tax=Streptomyces sp. NPDC018031 TaxID=3365033 RepID=UPI0037B51CB6